MNIINGSEKLKVSMNKPATARTGNRYQQAKKDSDIVKIELRDKGIPPNNYTFPFCRR